MKDADLIDAICKIIDPDLFGRRNTALNFPHEMAYNTARDQAKLAIRDKAARIVAILRR